MGRWIRMTPVMHAMDVDRAVRFFVEVLGFKAWVHRDDYAYVQREVAAVRILKASETPGEWSGPGTRAFRYYIDVEDVDEIVAELRPRLEAMWAGRVHGPVDQRYGQREFMIEGPDGDLVVFGQAIAEGAAASKDRED
jgi:catechol 2,3-dioxygenase-like lactoylglutathione lyase family enzyme